MALNAAREKQASVPLLLHDNDAGLDCQMRWGTSSAWQRHAHRQAHQPSPLRHPAVTAASEARASLRCSGLCTACRSSYDAALHACMHACNSLDGDAARALAAHSSKRDLGETEGRRFVASPQATGCGHRVHQPNGEREVGTE